MIIQQDDLYSNISEPTPSLLNSHLNVSTKIKYFLLGHNR
jgi:hypothetical protein